MSARALLILLAAALSAGCTTSQDPNALLRRQVVMSCMDGNAPVSAPGGYGRATVSLTSNYYAGSFRHCLQYAEKLVP